MDMLLTTAPLIGLCRSRRRSLRLDRPASLHPILPPIRIHLGMEHSSFHIVDCSIWCLWKRMYCISYAKVENYEADITGKQIFIKENAEGDADIQRMKNAVWVVLVNALLWLTSSLAGFVYWWTHKERTSRFTGRAKV